MTALLLGWSNVSSLKMWCETDIFPFLAYILLFMLTIFLGTSRNIPTTLARQQSLQYQACRYLFCFVDCFLEFSTRHWLGDWGLFFYFFYFLINKGWNQTREWPGTKSISIPIWEMGSLLQLILKNLHFLLICIFLFRRRCDIRCYTNFILFLFFKQTVDMLKIYL